jgi:hypothetical protein
MFKYKMDFLLATKTIIAVIVSVALTFWWLSPMALFYVVYTAAGMSLMQAGVSKKAQFFSMLLAGLCYLGLYLLGVYLRPDHYWAGMMLIPLAFIAYYIPNLGITYRLPPIMIVIEYLVVMMTPVPPADPLLTGLGICLASVVAGLVYFFLWHYSIKDELTLLMLEITEQYREGLQLIKLWQRTRAKKYLDQMHTGIEFCEAHVLTFEQIKAHPEMQKNKSQFFNTTEDALYAISKVIRLFIDILPRLPPERMQEFMPIVKDLTRTLKLQERKLSARFEGRFFTRKLLRKSFLMGKDVLLRVTLQQQIQKIVWDLPTFEAMLLKIVKPIQANQNKTNIDNASLQFAFGLLRIKELYTDLE